MNRKILGGFAAAAIVAVGALSLAGSASAAIDNVPVAGNVNVLPQARRVVPFPGVTLNKNAVKTIKIAGETFEGDAHIPADATGVVVSITELSSTADGSLRVWTTGAGTPSTGAVEFRKGESKTNLAFVALLQDGSGNAGRINVQATGGNVKFVLAVMSYYTPVEKPCVSKLYSIDPAAKTIENVGGTIKGTRSTDLGSVTLPKGTYDTRVVGGFTGLNNSSAVPEGVFLTGTMVINKGDEITSDFGSVLNTTGGVMIPRSSSDTLTQDPTVGASTFITLTQDTSVHVKLFAYASNSGTAGSGELKGNLQSAQFRSVC
jgi:hypothetical protein